MNSRGFTLLELMVVVAIVGILAGIAYPNYRNYVRSANRSDGLIALQQLQLAQEKIRANCRFYAKNLGTSNNCPTSATGSADVTVDANTTSPEGWYIIAISGTPTGNEFIATATAQGDQANDKEGSTSCSVLRLVVNTSNPRGIVYDGSATTTNCAG